MWIGLATGLTTPASIWAFRRRNVVGSFFALRALRRTAGLWTCVDSMNHMADWGSCLRSWSGFDLSWLLARVVGIVLSLPSLIRCTLKFVVNRVNKHEDESLKKNPKGEPANQSNQTRETVYAAEATPNVPVQFSQITGESARALQASTPHDRGDGGTFGGPPTRVQ